MADISITEAKAIFTQTLQAVYNERVAPTAFLRSFFKNKTTESKDISIEVRRGFRKIAVDVERGTEGNRNSFGKATLKIFEPPFYHEYFDATDLDFYDRLFTSEGVVDGNTFASWLKTIVEKLSILQDTIERAYELQCAQVLETGIVTLKNGVNIDFKRKAASKVDKGAGNYWATATVDPHKDMLAAATFLKTVGKSQGGVINALFGEEAYQDYLQNAKVLARADVRNYSLDMVKAPQANALGAMYHGQVSAGSYKVNLWTYPEIYDTEAAKHIPYLNPKNVVFLPETPAFLLSFAGVPQLLGNKANVGIGVGMKKGAFLVGEYLDPRNTSHNIDIKSAGVAVPVAVDQIYTLKVVAG